MGDSTRQATRSVFASRANSVARPHRERMRVLFIDQYSELGGAQQCLLDLLPAVRESGWEAHAAVPGKGPLGERLSSMGAAVRPIPCGPLSSGHKSWKDTWRFTSHAPSLASAIRDLATNLRPIFSMSTASGVYPRSLGLPGRGRRFYSTATVTCGRSWLAGWPGRRFDLSAPRSLAVALLLFSPCGHTFGTAELIWSITG